MRAILEFFKNLIPDSIFLRIKFRIKMGKPLHLRHPQTFNEKLQWLKLHDRNPEYTKLVDKYEVKDIVATLIGEQYIIPTYGVWNSFDEIDFESLPDQFVLKCTHDSGGIVICPDKKRMDIDAAREKINKCMKRNYYWVGREWPYKDVKPRIIAEKYMVDDSSCDLRDYKFFCFNGVPKALFVATDRNNQSEETKFDFFDMNFNHLPFTNGHPNSDEEIKRPDSFEKMVELAAKLTSWIPQVRADFYEVNGKPYFGELTFSHFSGMVPFEPEEWDRKFGDWIVLPDSDERLSKNSAIK